MRKLLMISLGPVMLVLLAATVLAAGRGAGDRATDIETPAPSHTPTTSTSTTTTGPIDVPQPEPPDAPPSTADRTSQPAALHFVCPDGGMDEVVALQHTVDEGHQPWRLSAPDVAAACTFGMPGTAVEPAGTNRYRVNHASSSESAMVDLAQPLGPDGIWVVTSLTPLATTAAAAPCAADAILPTTRQELERDGVVQIVAVKIEECRNGYARVSAVPGQLHVWTAGWALL